MCNLRPQLSIFNSQCAHAGGEKQSFIKYFETYWGVLAIAPFTILLPRLVILLGAEDLSLCLMPNEGHVSLFATSRTLRRDWALPGKEGTRDCTTFALLVSPNHLGFAARERGSRNLTSYLRR